MHSFGPFAKEQVIDFSLLQSHRLFLVTGQTGAGKTTILDAISFALYGCASGETRRPATLKSHHAPEEEVCWVQLDFSLHGNDYSVYRQPMQLGRKRDGSPKSISEKAELTMPDSEVIVGAQAVSAQIEEILGLGYEQFKQTIMLAQGEFRQLLEASSRDKQEIFSRIFGIEQFSALSRALAAKHASLSQQVQAGQQSIAHCTQELGRLGYATLHSDDAQFLPLDLIDSTVKEGLELNKQKLDDFLEQSTQLEKQRAAIDLDGAADINRKLDRLSALEQVVTQLTATLPEIEEQAVLLEKLKAARQLQEQRSIIDTTLKSHTQAKQRIQELTAQVESNKATLKAATTSYEQQPQRKQEQQEISAQLTTLVEHRRTLEQYNRHLTELEQRTAAQRLNQRKMLGLVKSAEMARLNEELSAYNSALELLEKISTLDLELSRLEQQHATYEHDYNQLYRQLLDGQAAKLATQLEDGGRCPVCGSTHHPIPATSKTALVEEIVVEKAKAKLDNIASQIVQCKADAAKSRDYLQHLSGLDLSGNTAQQIKQCQDNCERLKNALSELHRTAVQSGLDGKLQLFKSSLQASDAISKLEAILAADNEAVAALTKILEQYEKPKPEEMLNGSIATLEKRLGELTKAITEAERIYVQARSDYDRPAAQLEATTSHFDELSKQLESLEKQFMQRLDASGFDNIELYYNAAQKIGEIDDISLRIEKHTRTLADSKAMLTTLREDMDGKEKIDLDELKQRTNQLDIQLSTLREGYSELHAVDASTRNRLDELHRLHSVHSKLVGQYSIANELASLTKGTRGSGVSFERYILAAYFEDIIQIANIHLQRMTSSRYKLKRREGKTSGASSGLDMEVIDSYTGTERSVSTLSGGEGFKASLALALGLADVVQIYAGGVSIDTMFIDEGFGSLDEKSLDSAIETLLTLETSGRMVGIISHVPQLKQVISSKLLVNYSPTGSTVSFSGIQ